jgi:hypothetical protein
MKPLTIAPNRPLTVALVDPEGHFDLDRGMGTYQTTTGATVVLPRPAVVLLNLLEPRPGEEIVIQKHWTGKPKDKAEWFIRLTARSEKARAEAGEPGTLACQLGASIEAIQEREKPVRVPTPIGRPSKRKPAPEVQPRLFDRGTGTHGPACALDLAPLILPAAAAAGKIRPGQIPANVATREILEFVNADPNTANWSADARQDLVSTILIASFRAGYIGLWERKA